MSGGSFEKSVVTSHSSSIRFRAFIVTPLRRRIPGGSQRLPDRLPEPSRLDKNCVQANPPPAVRITVCSRDSPALGLRDELHPERTSILWKGTADPPEGRDVGRAR